MSLLVCLCVHMYLPEDLNASELKLSGNAGVPNKGAVVSGRELDRQAEFVQVYAGRHYIDCVFLLWHKSDKVCKIYQQYILVLL